MQGIRWRPLCLRLFQEGDVGGDALLIFDELLAEVRSQQMVLNAHADLRANDKEQESRQQQPPGRDQKTGAEQDAEQGRIDGMADEAIRSRGD